MKKIIALIMLLSVCLFSLASCDFFAGIFGENDSSKIRIGCLAGPTGMGMAKMIDDYGMDSDKYSFDIYSGPDGAKGAFTAGEVDAICFPTNVAANLYNALKGNVYVTAINCLGSLYLVSGSEIDISSIFDLEGKTIYASVPSSTTGAIMNHILKENGVNATVTFEFDGDVISEHDQLQKLLVKGDVDIAILPEPKASATLLSNPNANLSIDLNISKEWGKISDSSEPLTMGCIIFKKDFVENNKAAVDEFLAEYKSSIEYISNKENIDSSAQMIENAGILPKAAIAKKALNNLYGSIVYIDGNEMKIALKGFYNVIGCPVPDDNFYYEK